MNVSYMDGHTLSSHGKQLYVQNTFKVSMTSNIKY